MPAGAAKSVDATRARAADAAEYSKPAAVNRRRGVCGRRRGRFAARARAIKPARAHRPAATHPARAHRPAATNPAHRPRPA